MIVREILLFFPSCFTYVVDVLSDVITVMFVIYGCDVYVCDVFYVWHSTYMMGVMCVI